MDDESDTIDKVAIVNRQIGEAVLLFFEERDHIVIHTIIASAHQILFDLGKSAGVDSSIKNTSKLNSQEIQEFMHSVNYPYNFFKNADKYPDKEIDIGPLGRLTQDYIMDAIVMLQQLTGEIPDAAKVFWHWFVSYYPEEFDNLPKDGVIPEMQQQKFGEWSFPAIVQCLSFGRATGDNGA